MAQNNDDSKGNIMNFADYYDPDPEMTELLASPEWKQLCRDLDAMKERKKGLVRIPNEISARKFAKIMRCIRKLYLNKNYMLHFEYKEDTDELNDVVFVTLKAHGLNFFKESLSLLQEIINNADAVEITSTYKQDKIVVQFSVGDLYHYFEKK